MLYRPLGSSNLNVSAVVLGSWAIGGWMWGGSDEDASIRAVRRALDEGINAIDTAPVYGFGRAEEIVGKAIAGRRDEVVLMTKCGLIWEGKQGRHFFDSDEDAVTNGHGRFRVHRCLAADSIRREVDSSLRRLGTDRIDLYQTHWQDAETPIGETMEILLDLKRRGKILAIGVSNATASILQAYREFGPVAADQERFSLLDRKAEKGNLPYCRKHGLAFLAYSPLAQGLLSGKIAPGATFPPGDQRNDKPRFRRKNLVKAKALIFELIPLAAEAGLSPAQFAASWAISSPGCTHALVGIRTPGQAAEAAGVKELSPEMMARVENVLTRHPGIV